MDYVGEWCARSAQRQHAGIKRAGIGGDGDGQRTLMKPPSGAARRKGGWALTLGRRSPGDRIAENSGTCRFVAPPTARLWGTFRRGDLGSLPYGLSGSWDGGDD